MTPDSLFGSILFGSIGLAAFVYGRNMGTLKPRVFGVLLMVFPWFVSSSIALYTVGTALTFAMFVFRD